MIFQKEPLAPRHEYFLDAAMDAEELTAFGWKVLSLLGDRRTIAGIMDNQPAAHTWRLGRAQACLDLDAYAHEIARDLPAHEQEAFTAATLMNEPFRLNSFVDYLTHFNFEDETVGGCNQPFRRHDRCDRNFDPTPRARRRLYAPRAIRRFVKLEDSSLPLAQEYARRLKRLPLARDPGQAQLVVDLIKEQRRQFRTDHAEARVQYERRLWSDLIKPKDIDSDGRKVIKRAARTAAAIVGPDKVGAFARGLPVVLEGASLKLEVQPRGSIAATGHGAVDVRLFSAEGDDLSGVCVFFDGLPALDQLTALALHVGAGAEREIIQAGNLYNITAAGARHPIVAERQAAKRLVEGDARLIQEAVRRIEEHGVSISDHERKMIALHRYRADVWSIYLEAVEIRIWGRDGKAILAPYKEIAAAAGVRAEQVLTEQIPQIDELREAA